MIAIGLSIAASLAAPSAPITVTAPLTQGQHERVAKAVDGSDHLEDAFEALVENARQWSAIGEATDEPIRLRPDYAALLERPADFRGDLCRLSGILQQQTQLPPPFEAVREWFIRVDDGRPIAAYLINLEAADAFRDGQRVELDARFYKLVEFTARDGAQRSYPAFVGALPRVVSATTTTTTPARSGAWVWTLSGVLGAMALVFGALLIFVRRRPVRHYRAAGEPALAARSRPVDDQAPLPDDPAEALAELRRRARAEEADDDLPQHQPER